ncbi:hypothetical protein [Sandaracinobacteroides saxicola]|uniref:Uncharacterized protein n=1 Tax=Sandaracinobacteroides saxicola TaxID=2759707 RepID=A0A7G5IM06_9SPHN|nr:hypothetical protein [Sandaracinobacteroides saxicola]QMW24398.1 hypothetical protein H3309_08100 [Sandaracinobacteroides saxicola]
MRAVYPALLLTAFLGGCAIPGPWPSLAPRPAESERTIVAPAQPVKAALAPAEEARLTALWRTAEGQLLTRDAALSAALLSAKGSAAGSERWIAAQQALSGYEGAVAGLSEVREALEAALDAATSPAIEALKTQLVEKQDAAQLTAANAAAELSR